MTIIYHYARKTCPISKHDVWSAIESTGKLLTEMKVTDFADGSDSDLLWLTDDDEYVAGGANNYFGSLFKAFAGKRFSETREQFNAHIESNIADVDHFRRFAFVAEEIGAERWTRHKGRWAGISFKRKSYVNHIERISRLNGDDTRSYWITEHDVSLDQAVSVVDVEDSMSDRLAQFGFGDYYDFYCWYVGVVDRYVAGGGVSNDRINELLGSELAKRKNQQAQARIAA